ncbi:MAG: hypothetical protein Q8O31_02470, partial [Rhodocyclaceae bacterium]|nr:hypothetical protein [Rhodocyclaceae bacterium]
MFIRKTKTNNSATGECYFTYRLVRGERVGTKVRQITVLNLGRNFSVKPETWPLLCSRIEQMLRPSQILFDIPCPEQIESVAQRYVKQIVARALPSEETSDHIITKTETDFTPDSASIAPAIASSTHVPPSVSPTVSSSASPEHVNSTISPDFYEADINSIQLTQPRSVGVEHLALHALSQLGFVDKLTELGINGVMRASIMGNIIGRIAHPASELATWKWLETSSALDELLDIDFTSLSHMRLYRASDLLMKHRTAIEDHVFNAARTLFSLEETVTLFDLTNTYFEGAAAANPKAQRGRSKEKRSDCPLVT